MIKKKRFIIIDGNSVVHRAFHALPPLTTKKGELVNAVYGFLLVFLRAVRELKPDYIAACFDLPAPTFRHKAFKEYKAKRKPTPSELYQQIPKVKEVLSAFNVPIFEKEGFEADDIIGTITEKTADKTENIILSGDLDTLQLVSENTRTYFLRKGVKDIVLYDENLVKEKYQGLPPEKLVDFKALKGDPSDNIPGVRGIGEKTAIDLILKFGSLENLYKEVDEAGASSPPFADARVIEENSEKSKVVSSKTKEILIKYKDQAFLSRFLAQIEKKADIDFFLERCQWQKFDKQEVIKIFEKFEFQSLIKRLSEI